MRVAIVVNPHSGRGRALRAAQEAAHHFRAANWRVNLRPTTSLEHLQTSICELTAEGPDLILACGGDGSFCALINSISDLDVPLGIIPAGTGNDFCRTIQLSLNTDLAARQLLAGRPRRIDLLDVNDGQVRSVNALGMGLDAAVAQRLDRGIRRLGGLSAYLYALAAELIRLSPIDVQIEIDDRQWQGRVLLVAIANATSYGAGMKISPQSKIDDGLLDVIAVERMSRPRFVLDFPKVLRGTHLAHPRVHHWQGRHARIRTDQPQPVLADGDIRCKTPLDIQLLPKALTLWMPGDPT